jgi:hypothetical protein
LITPAEIRSKALRVWDSQRLLRSELAGESIFPLVIPFRKPSARELLEDFTRVRAWIQSLRQFAKAENGFGYSVIWKEVDHRSLGKQSLPDRIYFENREDLCRFIHKETEFQRWQRTVEVIETSFPNLRPWIQRRPLVVVEYEGEWPKLLSVLSYFCNHPKPNLYLRQIDIAGIDTKFIERRKPLFTELLGDLFPADPTPAAVKANYDFEQRYRLRYDEPSVRFRILDPQLASSFSGFQDLSVVLSEFKRIGADCERVYITENKINGLSFPPINRSIVIFGLGYGVAMLKEIGWLSTREVIYWGDIDTHGFAILSRLRSFLPQARSLLMDRETFLAFKETWGEEPADFRFTGDLAGLTDDENALFLDLRENRMGYHLRLEQERIPFSYVVGKTGSDNKDSP